MTQKKEVLTTFKRYLKRKGFRNVKMVTTDTDKQHTVSGPNLHPDLSADNKGVAYFYKYIESREDTSGLIKEVKAFLKEAPEVSNRRLKLLVPIKQSDAVIQSLNAHQLEAVGVIRVTPKLASA